MGRVVVVLVIAAFACGDDGPTDSGVADAGPDGAASIDVPPPVAPMAPVLTPCPAGWIEASSSDGDTTCEPWPGALPAPCLDHEARFPGAPGCARIGTECPADGVPEGVPATAIHVRAGVASGDGSLASPFPTINEALAVAEPGDVVAVAVGEYEEAIAPPAGVTVVGACVESTVVSSPAPTMSAGVITPMGADVVVRNLRIGPSERPGLWVAGAGTTVTATDLAIHDTRVAGVDVEGGALLTAERLAVRRTTANDLGLYGRGMTVETGAHAVVRDAVVQGGNEVGVLVVSTGTTLELTNVHVSDFEPDPAFGRSTGLAIMDGASMTASGLVIEDVAEVAVFVVEGSHGVIDHLVARDLRPGIGAGGPGRGTNVQLGGNLECRRCLFERVNEVGVFARDPGSHVLLEDTIVRDVLTRADGHLGRGISIQMGASMDAARIAVRRVHDCGLVVGEGGAAAHLEDVTVADVAAWDDGQHGGGVALQNDVVVDVARLRVDGVFEYGVVAALRATLTGSDVSVSNVRSREDSGLFGRGLIVQLGATADLTRAEVLDTHELGVTVFSDATLTLADAHIARVSPADCVSTTCEARAGGHGLGVYAGSTTTVTRFAIEGAALCGLHVADAARATLADGVVRQTLIGACVESDAQPIDALQDNVRYVENGRNLDSTMLPVPEPLPTPSE